jgi:hypothetical protein
MNNTVKQAIVIVSLMIAGAASSFGQMTDRAQIDFPFLVGKKSMPAGTYEIVRENVSGGVTFLKLSTNRVTTALTIPRYNGQHEEKPSLTFRCVAVELCSLVAVKTGNGSKWLIPAPNLTAAQTAAAREVVVGMHTVKAD